MDQNMPKCAIMACQWPNNVYCEYLGLTTKSVIAKAYRLTLQRIHLGASGNFLKLHNKSQNLF